MSIIIYFKNNTPKIYHKVNHVMTFGRNLGLRIGEESVDIPLATIEGFSCLED